MNTLIYHVTTHEEWLQAQQAGFYTASSLELEGFIHCSTIEQVKGVLERYFVGKTNLVKLVIDTTKLQPELKYEMSPSVNEEFPHVFGNINLDAIVSVQNISKTNTL
jgi:uncharacterized protein (DUF952 family)